MLTYKECIELGPKKLENNTHLVSLHSMAYGVKLHNTVILEIWCDGTYRFHTGGYRTMVTKDRLNKYGPVGIWQHKGQWYYMGRSGETLKFEEGMLV